MQRARGGRWELGFPGVRVSAEEDEKVLESVLNGTELHTPKLPHSCSVINTQCTEVRALDPALALLGT